MHLPCMPQKARGEHAVGGEGDTQKVLQVL
jgi:hypothetical protein